jgi:serine protease AprX
MRHLRLLTAAFAASLLVGAVAASAAPGTEATRGAIVRLQPGVDVAPIERTVGPFHDVRRLELIDGFAARLTDDQIDALRRRADVLNVEADAPAEIENDSAQAAFGVSAVRTQVSSLDGDRDGKATRYSRNDIVVAVLDTGIDSSHPDLNGGKVIGWYDAVAGRSTPYDDNGHGTHVAATIAGEGDSDWRYRGVAPRAALVGVKVTPADGVAVMSNVIAGLDWVVRNKDTYRIRIVNLSLGATGCWDGTEAQSVAVNRAVEAGLTVVVAAGNGGPGTCTVKSPGAAEKGLTVASMADLEQGGFSLARDSSRGPTADGRIKPDIAGPGVLITSARAGGGFVAYSGTSMAAPFVAGVAALMLDQNTGLTATQIKDTLMATAVDWGRGGDTTVPGSRGKDIDYGAGRVDAWAALRAVGASVKTAPAMPAHVIREGTLAGTGTAAAIPISVSSTTYPLAVTLNVPGASSSKDFDLELLDPAGARVAFSEEWGRQDLVSVRPAGTGVYTLRVVSYVGGGDWFVDISGPLAGGSPPVVSVPADMTLPATSPSGAPVTYQVTASDPDGTIASPLCSPASGSFFPVGATTVTCTATDNTGLTTTARFAVTVLAPTGPANDFFASAMALPGSDGLVDATSTGATREPGEPAHAGQAGGASVWFTWTAPLTATVTFETAGSALDTLLAVYRGTSVSALTTVAANDDVSSSVFTSRTSFQATAGTTYAIAVDGYKGAAGALRLTWSIVVGPENDSFASAIALAGASGVVEGTTLGATKEPGEPSHAGNVGGASVWYRWTAPASGTATLETVGSSFDTLLAVYHGGAVSSLTQVAANDDVSSSVRTSRVTFAAEAGTTYLIAVDGYKGTGAAATGAVKLTWR